MKGQKIVTSLERISSQDDESGQQVLQCLIDRSRVTDKRHLATIGSRHGSMLSGAAERYRSDDNCWGKPIYG